MIAARQIFLGRGGGAKLPYDAEVEYLESTGTQYIDTGVIADSNVGFAIDGMMLERTADIYPGICGAQTDDWTYFISIYEDYGQVFIGAASYVSQRLNTRFLGQVNYRNDGLASVDPPIASYPASVDIRGELRSINARFMLFALGSETSVQCFSKSRIYGASFSRGDVLVRNMTPVRFTNEGGVSEGAVYDRVSGALFRNAGTGAFLYGNDITANSNGGHKCLNYSSFLRWRSRRAWKEAA